MNVRWLLILGCGLSGTLSAANYWQCEDASAISRGPEALAEILGTDANFCRRTNVRGVDTLNCELPRSRSAFGLGVVEVSASIQQGGTRRLSLVFKSGQERVQRAVESRLGLRFEDGLRGLVATPADDFQRHYRLAERDDGATQLACEISGAPDPSLQAVVEGQLSYPGAGSTETRVCAIPVGTALPIRCVELPPRLRHFRIDGLAGADYYLAAYPMADNPDGVVAAFGRPLRDCTDAPPGCVATLLVPLRVKAGETQGNVVIEQRFAGVPERVGLVREPH